ncbi:PAS domain-containing protein [Breoghania corrubedonensis]|nr:PAS domain-containing protein [Breoghania corrubedonensis]
MAEATQRKAKPMTTASDTQSQATRKMPPANSDITGTPEFDGLLSLLRVATWLYDPHKNMITWQRIFAETPGETRAQITERLGDVVARYSEEDRPNLLRHYESALRDGHHGPVRFTVMNRAGIPTHIESAAIRSETKSGVPVVRGIFRNCEEDVGREVALQDALTLLSRLTSMSPSAIMLLDENGLIRSANPQFLSTFHITDERMVVARHIRASGNVLGKGFVATIVSLMENAKDLVNAQQRFQLADNSMVTLTFRCQRFGVNANGKGLLFAGEITDPDAINMGAVFDRLPTPAIAVTLHDNMIAAANTAALRTFGLRREHVGNDTITQILMRGNDIDQIRQHIAADGGEAGFVCPVRSLLGGALNYRVKASEFSDDGRSFLILEFHETKAGATPREKTAQHGARQKKGLLSRVVDHLDF